MKNMTELRNALTHSFTQLLDDDIAPKKLDSLTRCTSAVLGTTKAQIRYNELTKSTRKIKFLECE